MKSLFVLFFCFLTLPVFAYSSKASNFAEMEFAKINNCEKVHINMKKEYMTEYKQKNGQIIIYGWGDMKIRGGIKRRITYTVLFNEEGKATWSSIKFYQ